MMKCLAGGCEVNYEIIGEGMPVINLHGSTLDMRSMIGCMEPIFENRKGWKRIYPDFPGHGRTPGCESIKGSDDVLRVLLDFIDNVIPDTQFALTGLSFGGYIAQGIIHYIPNRVAGLLLIVPRVISHPGQRNLPKKSVLARDNDFLSKVDLQERAGFEEVAVLQTKNIWNRYVKEISSGVRVADTIFLQRLDPAIDAFSFDMDARAKKFDKPTLILTGRQDHIVGYQDTWTILDRYPHATFAAFDRAGHALQLEQEILFNALVNEWLDRVEETET